MNARSRCRRRQKRAVAEAEAAQKMEFKQTDVMGGNFKLRTNRMVSFTNIANLIQVNITFMRFMYTASVRHRRQFIHYLFQS